MMKNENIKIGLGETIITPRENLQMHGFGLSQVATGVHDDLHSRCMIVQDASGNTAVILSVSIVELEKRETGDRVRNDVAKATGIPKEAIMLSCTHTHSGPYVEKAPQSYQDFFVEQIAKSAEMALKDLSPGRIGVRTGVQLEVGRNRRRLLYGGLHPDPELAVLRIEDMYGELRGVIFNYGCHPATLDWRNTLYSEDWPYYAIKGIKEEIGDDKWVCFLQGAQGDINTGYDSLLSAIGVYMPVRDYSYIKYKGKQMAESVLDILPNITTDNDFTVNIISEFHNLPLRREFPVTLEEAEKNLIQAEKELAEIKVKPEYKGSRKLDKYRVNAYSAKQTLELAQNFYSGNIPKNESIEFQVFRLGDIILFALPGEVFSEIALAVKKASPFKYTFGVGVTNGYYAYMPTKEEFIDGDYEVDGSKYSPETADIFVENMAGIIKKLLY